MILAIDVGNTNIVLGCIDDGDIRSIVRIQTNPGETAAEYAIKLKQILEIYDISPRAFEGAIISSVVPPLTNSLKEAVRKLTGIECLVVGPGMRTGMNVRIDDPGTLAATSSSAASPRWRPTARPSSCSTWAPPPPSSPLTAAAPTSAGAIIPGVNLSYGALAAGTSLLPSISITAPKKVIATNTVDSMRSGAVYGIRRNARRHDRAHGGRAWREVHRRCDRRAGVEHHPLLPPRDHLRRRSAAEGSLDTL